MSSSIDVIICDCYGLGVEWCFVGPGMHAYYIFSGQGAPCIVIQAASEVGGGSHDIMVCITYYHHDNTSCCFELKYSEKLFAGGAMIALLP